MSLTPVEIRHVELRRTWFRGYRRGIVERLLTDIADSFEDVWRERADLADRVEELEADASKHRELEELLRATLVSAERSAQDVREQARRESDLIVQEAHAEGRRVTRATLSEKVRLEKDIRRIRAQLRSALEAMDEPDDAEVEHAASRPAGVAPAVVEGAGESSIRRAVG
jgi:cell division initiation protein